METKVRTGESWTPILTCLTVRGRCTIPMDVFIRESGRMVRGMARELPFFQIMIHIQENIKGINDMEWESINGMTGESIKEDS